MITNKDDERKSQGHGLDVEAFEVQIDKEIDSLFVPGDSQLKSDEGAGAVHVIDDVDIQVVETPGPAAGEASQVSGTKPEMPAAAINVEAFEVQIDKEIDNLFVPFDSEPRSEPDFSPASPAPLAKTENLYPEEPKRGENEKEPEGPLGKLELELESVPAAPIPERPEVEAVARMEETSASQTEAEVPSAELRSPELKGLVEGFNIAYLSLDWEFTTENVSNLWAALEKLAGYCERSRETQFLFKLLRSLLHRLKTNTDALQPEVIEIMRDAQESLKTLLLSESGAAAGEKERLRTLVSRYRTLRDSFGERKESSQETVPVKRISPFEALKRVSRPDWATMGPDGWMHWLESLVQLNGEVLQILEGEEETFREMEGSLPKTVAFRGVVRRLGEVSSFLGDYVSFCKEKETELREGIQWLKGHRQGILDNRAHPDSVMVPSQESADRMESAHPAKELKGEELDASPAIRHDQVFIFNMGGKEYALPAKHVVKIDRIKPKRLEKMLAAGYATLKDFKPFYKSIRSGLLGAFHGLPTEVLKDYRFAAVPSQSFGIADHSINSSGVILVSTGKYHGIILVDSPAVVLHNDVPIKVKRDENRFLLGTIGGDSVDPVEVLDMDALLRKLNREGREGP